MQSDFGRNDGGEPAPLDEPPVGDTFEPAAFTATLSPLARLAFEYWNFKRGGRTMPRRRDVDPLDMRAWLAEALLLDVIENGRDFYCRVAGSAIRGGVGVELTGRRLAEAAEAAPLLAHLLQDGRRAVAKRRPTYSRQTLAVPGAQGFAQLELMLTPLSEDGRAVSMLLGLWSDPARPASAR